VTAADKATEKTPINDSWITAKTKIALFVDARVKGSEINVETTQGLVMIHGKVDADAVRRIRPRDSIHGGERWSLDARRGEQAYRLAEYE
jgi:hypothetical protein